MRSRSWFWSLMLAMLVVSVGTGAVACRQRHTAPAAGPVAAPTQSTAGPNDSGGPTPAPRSVPSVADLIICDTQTDCGERDVRTAWEQVTACVRLSMQSGEASVLLVATVGQARPSGPESPEVVARSAVVQATAALSCHPVRATTGALPPGQYWLWVLYEAQPLYRLPFVLRG